jgi:ABC-2 type transport system permease protein
VADLPVAGRGLVKRYGRELRKLAAQKRTYIGIGAAALLPVVFVVVMALQSGGPYDAPLGHNLRKTGLAITLVVLTFGRASAPSS